MPPSLPASWSGLIDDAAIFPPGNAPLADALAAHAAHRESRYADLVGAFVLRDTDLPLAREVGTGPGTELSIVVTGGAGQIAGPAGLCRRSGLTLAGLEIALRDLDDLPGNARRVVAAVDGARDAGVLDDETAVYVELPQAEPTPGWLAAADVVAESELRLKFRTGGLEAHQFPTAAALAAWVEAALDRETPFKCTAGLHNAVAHTDPETGFERHGFLNVLLATRTALDGGDVTGVLTERDGTALVALFGDHGDDTMARTRRWFTSFGSCSVREPLDDLIAIGLVSP